MLDVALEIFADQLRPWKPEDLKLAVETNKSLATEIRIYKSSELQLWRNLAASIRILNRQEYNLFFRSLTYTKVLQHLARVNPRMARAIEETSGADMWLLRQISECKALFQ